MPVEIPLALTAVAAILVLLAGRALIARVSLLRTYSIPEPVVGGLAAALLLTLAAPCRGPGSAIRYPRPSPPAAGVLLHHRAWR